MKWAIRVSEFLAKSGSASFCLASVAVLEDRIAGAKRRGAAVRCQNAKLLKANQTSRSYPCDDCRLLRATLRGGGESVGGRPVRHSLGKTAETHPHIRRYRYRFATFPDCRSPFTLKLSQLWRPPAVYRQMPHLTPPPTHPLVGKCCKLNKNIYMLWFFRSFSFTTYYEFSLLPLQCI